MAVSTFDDGAKMITCPSSPMVSSEVTSGGSDSLPQPLSMTRLLVIAAYPGHSSSDRDESSDETTVKDPPISPTTYDLNSRMYLERHKVTDVSLDLDLFVFDLSEDDHNAKAERVGMRGRKKGSTKRRSSPPSQSISPTSLTKQRRKSEAPNAKYRQQWTSGVVGSERGRTRTVANRFSTDELTSTNLEPQPVETPLLKNQREQLSATADTFNKVLRYKPMPSILVKPQQDTILPRSPSTSPLRLRFADASGFTQNRQALSPPLTLSSPSAGAPLPFPSTHGADKTLATRRPSFVLGPPPRTMSLPTPEPRQDRPIRITTVTPAAPSATDQPPSAAAMRRDSSSLFLPMLKSDPASPTIPTTRSSATPTVRLCKVCATFHKSEDSESSGKGTDGTLGSDFTVDMGQGEGQVPTAGVPDFLRRLSLPDLTASTAQSAGRLLFALGGGAGGGGGGGLRGRARSQSDTRALLESLQAVGRLP